MMQKKKQVMGPVTLRNLPDEIAFLVRKMALDKRMSLKKAIISLLEERTGTGQSAKRRVLHHELDFLSGTWSEKEALAFNKTLKLQRGIGPGCWRF